MNRTPYTYLIGWSHLNKWYYGRRTAKNCQPDELWAKYFTSSKVVAKYKIEHGDPDIVQIRKVFDNIEKCKEWEAKVLVRLDAQHNEKFLNDKNGDANWDTTNLIVAFDSKNGNGVGLVSADDIRFITSEIRTSRHSDKTKDKMSKYQKFRLDTNSHNFIIDHPMKNDYNKNKLKIRTAILSSREGLNFQRNNPMKNKDFSRLHNEKLAKARKEKNNELKEIASIGPKIPNIIKRKRTIVLRIRDVMIDNGLDLMNWDQNLDHLITNKKLKIKIHKSTVIKIFGGFYL